MPMSRSIGSAVAVRDRVAVLTVEVEQDGSYHQDSRRARGCLEPSRHMTAPYEPKSRAQQPRNVWPVVRLAFRQANAFTLRAAVASALPGEVRLETTDETMVWRSVEIWG